MLSLCPNKWANETHKYRWNCRCDATDKFHFPVVRAVGGQLTMYNGQVMRKRCENCANEKCWIAMLYASNTSIGKHAPFAICIRRKVYLATEQHSCQYKENQIDSKLASQSFAYESKMPIVTVFYEINGTWDTILFRNIARNYFYLIVKMHPTTMTMTTGQHNEAIRIQRDFARLMKIPRKKYCRIFISLPFSGDVFWPWCQSPYCVIIERAILDGLRCDIYYLANGNERDYSRRRLELRASAWDYDGSNN